MRFVLVHGSWHDGGCWDDVRRHLEAAGHEVHTPTLPGNGAGAARDVTMRQVVDAVVGLLESSGLDDVVLVGHSFGGAVVQQVALRVPERLRRMVFHNAYVVRDGGTVFDDVPASVAPAFQALAEAAGDGTVSLPFDFFREAFCNDADLATAQAAHARMTPEPLARSTEPLALTGFVGLPVPRSYLYATEDNVFPATEFSWHPQMSSRLGPFRLVQMHGSHEVLFTDPAGLAGKLVEAGRD
jgi:pimeloyl-ACP methyl ester carboxylesterase